MKDTMLDNSLDVGNRILESKLGEGSKVEENKTDEDNRSEGSKTVWDSRNEENIAAGESMVVLDCSQTDSTDVLIHQKALPVHHPNR